MLSHAEALKKIQELILVPESTKQDIFIRSQTLPNIDVYIAVTEMEIDKLRHASFKEKFKVIVCNVILTQYNDNEVTSGNGLELVTGRDTAIAGSNRCDEILPKYQELLMKFKSQKIAIQQVQYEGFMSALTTSCDAMIQLSSTLPASAGLGPVVSQMQSAVTKLTGSTDLKSEASEVKKELPSGVSALELSLDEDESSMPAADKKMDSSGRPTVQVEKVMKNMDIAEGRMKVSILGMMDQLRKDNSDIFTKLTEQTKESEKKDKTTDFLQKDNIALVARVNELQKSADGLAVLSETQKKEIERLKKENSEMQKLKDELAKLKSQNAKDSKPQPKKHSWFS